MAQKACSVCFMVKPIVEFHLSSSGKFGRSQRCKICTKAYHDGRKHIKAAYDKARMADFDVQERKYEKVRQWHKANPTNRRKTTQDRLANNLRTRIRIALHGSAKCAPTYRLIGVSGIEEFRSLMEKKFKPGMTWENYGRDGWHIDHIRPCASFDLSDPRQQRECFHHTNLQPLWALENIRKGDR